MTKRWYIIHAYSNFEKKVAESVQERASLLVSKILLKRLSFLQKRLLSLEEGERSLLKNDSFLGMF